MNVNLLNWREKKIAGSEIHYKIYLHINYIFASTYNFTISEESLTVRRDLLRDPVTNTSSQVAGNTRNKTRSERVLQ